MRLLRPLEFSRVYDTRQSASAGPLVLYAAAHRANPDGVRVGLSVSRRTPIEVDEDVVREASDERPDILPPIESGEEDDDA